MAFQKNQILTLSIESLSNDGSGVAHHDGQAVFVAAAAPGDVAEVRIVKPMKGYAFGKLEKLLTPGPGRVKQDCPVAGPCGGCGLRHISYAAECAAKTQFVRDAFERLAKLDVPVHEVLGAPAADRYRNKVQLPVGTDENGHLVTGFFAGRSHRIVPCADCKLQPDWMNALAARACTLLEENGITAYNEETHTGRVRHLYMRQGWHSGQRLLCFVVNGNGLPNEAEICEALQKEFDLTTILINRNNTRTNVILGAKTRVALGPGYIEDTLSGVSLRMGVHEFYQVNTPAAEALYAKAREFAALTPDDFLLDLYCGMGTIGLSMLPDCRRLVGVEVVPQAVDGAKETAARKADFRCQDAGAAAAQLAAEGARPDVIVVDPPRKGCDEATLTSIAEMAPRTVVMVSCNAATAARDTRWLVEHGYKAEEVQPVDLFPRTKHVETVVLLSKGEVDSKKIRVEFSLEDMDMSEFQDGATYTQIKDYVLEHSGLKVSNLYISQIKRKCGIEVGKNYNLPKSEDSRQPMCPPEKEKAIREAFKYFGMI